MKRPVSFCEVWEKPLQGEGEGLRRGAEARAWNKVTSRLAKCVALAYHVAIKMPLEV